MSLKRDVCNTSNYQKATNQRVCFKRKKIFKWISFGGRLFCEQLCNDIES